jgi:hypothetical protein
LNALVTPDPRVDLHKFFLPKMAICLKSDITIIILIYITIKHFLDFFSFFSKSYHLIPWRDSISRSIAPVS